MKKTDSIAYFLTSFFRDYMMTERNLSQNTIVSYRDSLKLFLLFAKRETGKPCTKLLMDDISGILIRRFLAHLEEERGNSVRSRNNRLAALRSFFEYIAGFEPQHAGLCQEVTSVPLKKGPQTSIDYLEKPEIEALFEVIDKTQPGGLRDYALLLFLYNAGARVSEAVELRISWLTLTKPYRVNILGKGRKWRSCPLWLATGNILQQLLAQRTIRSNEEHVFINRFGGSLSRRGILDIVKKYVKKATINLPRLSQKKISPHTLRHTCAMHLLQSGVELNVIRSWLGHASIETTHHYAQIDLEMKTRALERCEASFLNSNQGSSPPSWKENPDILNWLESL